MKITWLGHSCFVLESGGYRLMLDPYQGVPGLPDTAGEVNEVLCSHGHQDHAYVDGLKLLGGESPFACRKVESFHDGEGGALRGKNTIHCLTVEGIYVTHLGDLGHLLTDEQIAEILPCDVLMIPVGGTYTIDSEQARKVVDQLQPLVVIPMHYRDGVRDYEALEPAENFLRRFPEDMVRRHGSNTMTVNVATSPQVAVLRCEQQGQKE